MVRLWYDSAIRFTVALAALAGVSAVAGHAFPSTFGGAQRSESTEIDLEARIALLIDQLGDPRYATRERAQAELRRLRLDAFDALNEAQYSDDIEIALSARYLVRGMQVHWSSEDDPLEVKHLLKEYSPRPDSERQNLIEQLALLGSEQALRPLCRLVRYEASEKLSKQAALAVLRLAAPQDGSARRELAEALRGRMGKSKRSAAEWVRAHADMLADMPAAQQQWRDLIEQEEMRLVQMPDQTSREILRDLLKWYSDQLTQRAAGEEALAVTRQIVGLLNSTNPEVLDAVDWFRGRENWPMIAEVAERFPDLFQRSPELLYRLAETRSQLGDQEAAEQAAGQAFAAVLPDSPEKHMETAANLQHDGLFTWAEREYRHVAGLLDEAPAEAIRAQFFLSEMLHDVQQDGAASDVLTSLIQTVEQDADIRKIVELELGREVQAIRSRQCFFQAQHLGRGDDIKGQREWLLAGYQHDPHDVDLLIAMYRLPSAEEDWTRETRQRLNDAAEYFRQQIRELTDRMHSARAFEDRALATIHLALVNNQFAWLIANTEGDFDEALRCSQRSLELQPNRAGFLDTLGRCYYAKGDYANAVLYQSQAVAMEPHAPQMQAQLRLFAAALEQQQAAESGSKLEGDAHRQADAGE